MLAPATLPLRYRWFNARWGAPDGRLLRAAVPIRRRLDRWLAPFLGCFAFQANNTTRRFEYPWAFEAIRPAPGLDVLEIGGGLSGLQFVLDRAGCRVTNVDPGDPLHTTGWPITDATMARLNRVFHTNVRLKSCFLHAAAFPDESFDRVVSVSVFEHVPDDVLAPLLAEVRRVLRRGGLLVMTVDLFLDVRPFATAEANVYGRNASVKWIADQAGMDLVAGHRSELFGYPEFDAADVIRRRDRLLVGRYPAMVQAVVLRKPA